MVWMDNRCLLIRKRSGDIAIGYYLLSNAIELVLPILVDTVGGVTHDRIGSLRRKMLHGSKGVAFHKHYSS